MTDETKLPSSHIRIDPAAVTICGAPITDRDMTLADARNLRRDDIDRFQVCQMCLARMPAETFELHHRDPLGRKRQARHVEAQRQRDDAKAAWFNREPAVVAADLERLHDLLFNRARWKYAYTMSANPHSYTLRKTWERDDDFIWVCGVIRTIGDREAYPPPPNPASRWYRVYNTMSPRSGIATKFWTMNFPLGSLDWGWGRLNTMGTTLINRKPPRLPEDER